MNERIEPLPQTPGIHLHERSGFGSGGQAKKDPTNTIYTGSDFKLPPIPGFFPPPSLLPPLDLPPATMPPPLDFPLFPLGEEPPINAETPPAFPFVYSGGIWWAVAEVDFSGAQVDPYWVPFAPIANLRFNTSNGNVEYWDGTVWTSWADLPTSDPGNGGIWLSAT